MELTWLAHPRPTHARLIPARTTRPVKPHGSIARSGCRYRVTRWISASWSRREPWKAGLQPQPLRTGRRRLLVPPVRHAPARIDRIRTPRREQRLRRGCSAPSQRRMIQHPQCTASAKLRRITPTTSAKAEALRAEGEPHHSAARSSSGLSAGFWSAVAASGLSSTSSNAFFTSRIRYSSVAVSPNVLM